MKEAFFQNFLMISEIKTLVFIFLLFLSFVLLNKLPKEKFGFSSKVMIGTILGLILGFLMQVFSGFSDNPTQIIFVKEATKWYSLFGSGFISIIKMIVIPLVMISIIHVIINLQDSISLKKLVKNALIVNVITVAIAGIVGMTLAICFNLGLDNSVATQGAAKIKDVKSIVDIILNLIPSNPVSSMVSLNIVALVIFSAFIAQGANKMTKKYPQIMKPFNDLINACYKIVFSMAMSIIKFMPYAVVALLASTIAQKGLIAILEVGKFIILIYVASVIVLLIQLLTLFIFGLNPLTFIKKSLSLWMLAFTSRSSVGCLPVTISTLTNKLGVNASTANFIASFGTTAGMQGCAGLYPGLLIIFVANQVGINVDIGFCIMAIIVISLSSFGIAGIPGTPIMSASANLSGTGLASHFHLISPIIAVDPIIDMARTTVNVTGSAVNAIIVDKSLGLINMKDYNDLSLIDFDKA